MQDTPRISIVTPSFNQGQFLEQTIRSVLSQGYPNLEYIVLDGGSTDGSVEIIKRYEKQISFWRSKRDNGHYDAINEGFSRSTGDILAWINSDDIYFPWTFTTVAAMMSSIHDMRWLSSLMPAVLDYDGLVYQFDRLPGFSREAFLEGKNLPGEDTLELPFGFIQQESTFWRRGLWEKVGGIRTQYKLAGDFDLWARFFQHADLWGCPIPLGGFRTHFQQRSGNQTEYRKETKDSLADARRAAKWSKGFWRRGCEFLGLSRIWLTSRIIRKINYYMGLKKYQGFMVSRDRQAYPDCAWVPIKHRF
jgi:glycosyltransferase involved in cell wall biosynthesis